MKKEICLVGARLRESGFIVALDGNISVRLTDGRILITPGGADKGSQKSADILLLDADGRMLGKSAYRPSSETLMHLAIYRARPDVSAIVHAHPPAATAFAVCGTLPPVDILPEAILMVGEISLVPYATPGSMALADLAAEHLRNCDAALLQNHGVVTLGGNLQEAFHRLETVEHLARVYEAARRIGIIQKLPAGSIAELKDLKKRRGR